MLGRTVARLERQPRRVMQYFWGERDIHARQKWSFVWPLLSRIDTRNVTMLDAGCGSGTWVLEVADRRPEWTVSGIDRDVSAIQRAEATRQQLNVQNARFEAADFLDFSPPSTFDVVLSIASAHYLVEKGEGGRLFRQFASWLSPGGRLFLLGPRKEDENPVVSFLPNILARPVFSRKELEALCCDAGLRIESLVGCVGPAGTLAKQLSLFALGKGPLPALLYPIAVGLSTVDRMPGLASSRRSTFWLLIAKKLENKKA
jgi:SAM-dependent methyltransferase